MSGSSLELRPADETDLTYVEQLLERNELPAGDVRSKPDCFSVASVDRDPVGVGGVEVYGSDGLLRSVVVEESARGEGFGTALCDALENQAAADGVTTLFLLTTTAADFFAGRGYVEIDRDEAPASIRGTTEFADLCPRTATAMCKSLRQ